MRKMAVTFRAYQTVPVDVEDGETWDQVWTKASNQINDTAWSWKDEHAEEDSIEVELEDGSTEIWDGDIQTSDAVESNSGALG